MKPYCIFFDIDGTLFDEETKIMPESAKKAIRLAHEAGHYLFINTGRCQAIWPKDLLQLEFDGVVGGCGTHIVYQGEEVLHHELPQELCKNVADDLIRWKVDGVLEGAKCMYFREDILLPQVQSIFRGLPGFEGVADGKWTDTVLHFDKMALWHNEKSQMERFRQKYKDEFDFIFRDPTFDEVVPKGYSKASGMDVILGRLDIPKTRAIAIGDSANDISMFANAGISISLKTENEEVMKQVDYVTDTVMGDGIYHAFEHFGLLD